MDFELSSSLSHRGITDPRVLAAMMRVDRTAFVPLEHRSLAHADTAVPIGHEQTVSQPFVVAHVLTAVDARPGRKVLEIGTGSGWLAALLAELGCEVFSIERIRALAEAAATRLGALEYRVRLKVGDGAQGWPDEAPFDAIVISAAAESVPPTLLFQLADGGRLIVPLGPPGRQLLTLIEKHDDRLTQQVLLPVTFVPLKDGVTD